MMSHRFGDIEEAVSGDMSRGDHLRYLRHPLHLAVGQYNKQYDNRLNGSRFSAMRLTGEKHGIPDVGSGRSQGSAIGAWMWTWWLHGKCVATELLSEHMETDRSHVCCFEEVGCG